VNAEPHIGHAYSTIVADVLTRFHTLAGSETFFLTGTDEHGDKIVIAAEKAGKTPKEYVDSISKLFSDLWPRMNISNDYFVRTTDPAHMKTVEYILNKVNDRGDIYFSEYEGLYCLGCERFYTERELVDGKCPDHQTEPEVIKESNYFFRMSKYQDWLIVFHAPNPGSSGESPFRLTKILSPMSGLMLLSTMFRHWDIRMENDSSNCGHLPSI